VFFKPEVDCGSHNVAELDLPAFGENAEFDVGVVGNCDLKESLTFPPSVAVVFWRDRFISPALLRFWRWRAIKRWDSGDAGRFG